MHRLALLSSVLFIACSNANSGQPDASHPGVDAPADAGGGTDSGSGSGSGMAMGSALSYTSGTYTSSFDGLPSSAGSADDVSQVITGQGPFPFSVLAGSAAATGMDGWMFGNPNGSSTNTEFRAQDGSLSGSTGRGVISYGADGSTSRALGVLATSNQIPNVGVAFRRRARRNGSRKHGAEIEDAHGPLVGTWASDGVELVRQSRFGPRRRARDRRVFAHRVAVSDRRSAARRSPRRSRRCRVAP